MKPAFILFTNCTKFAPSTEIIQRTYKSFCDAFGVIVPTAIYLDKHPCVGKYLQYRKNLKAAFPGVQIINTDSLSDGYIRAVRNTDAEYLFMCEHDWIFKSQHIKHGLDEIITEMKSRGIYHLRFNKRDNLENKGWDKELIEHNDGLTWCKTQILSNNPHLLNREKYLDFIRRGYIQVKPGSKGIEDIISRQFDTWGAIYGGKNYPATLWHTDGRRGRVK